MLVRPDAMATFMRLLIAALMIAAAASQSPPTVYNNHTVGGKAGWFFNSTTNTSAVNCTSWAATETFDLGDFLIFNTNSNQTVIQTFNGTTFRSCAVDDSDSDDLIQYGGGSTAFGVPLTIAVPLTIEGPNYFFSDADDGLQCQQGLAFEIQVNHGLGLPASLNQPPPPPYKAPPSPQSPPITIPSGGSETQENRGFKEGANLRSLAFALVVAVTTVALEQFFVLSGQ